MSRAIAPAPHEFIPPPARGLGPSFLLALLAHALLIGALAAGIRWNRDVSTPVVAAELWAAVPVAAAPRAVEPPPAPLPPPEPVRRAEPPPPPPPSEADIALERARKREQEQRAREEAQRKAERRKAEDKKAAERKEQERQLAEERRRKEDQQKKAEQKKADERRREAAAEKQREALREEQLRRIQGLAGATGGPQATGGAERSAAPSASYAGRIVARVKPNIVFTDAVSGNPEAEVEVRAAPDGTIIGRRILKSSGVRTWDDAVLRALDRTETLPRDIDGRVPSPMILVFRPRD